MPRRAVRPAMGRRLTVHASQRVESVDEKHSPDKPQCGSDRIRFAAMPDLLVCVEGDASDTDAAACRGEFERLMTRSWTYRPEMVDTVDPIAVVGPDDLPAIRTVGLVVALPDPEHGAGERAVRHDVTQLVDSISSLARRAGLGFVVEYREEEIGFLDGGPLDGRFLGEFFGD
jgi:hypothetical protein